MYRELSDSYHYIVLEEFRSYHATEHCVKNLIFFFILIFLLPRILNLSD